MSTVTTQENLFTRGDTLLGICEALGQDFRFNPLPLRVAFALGLFFNPYLSVGLYLGLGVVVLLSRLVSPNPKAKGARPAEAAAQTEDNDNQQESLAAAA